MNLGSSRKVNKSLTNSFILVSKYSSPKSPKYHKRHMKLKREGKQVCTVTYTSEMAKERPVRG